MKFLNNLKMQFPIHHFRKKTANCCDMVFLKCVFYVDPLF